MADFTMYAGDTKVLAVTVLDNVGDPVDITGTDIRWWMAKNAKKIGADVLLKKETGGDGIVITDGPGGVFEVTLDSADTENLKGPYYHEAEVDDAGVISTVLTGKATINLALIKPE